MFVLHRRNLKKQRREDAEDRHKSLDFGLEPGQVKPGRGKKGIKGPEMSVKDAHNQVRRGRALSMDIDMGVSNPYLLPPGLQHSRESLHSLSRSFNTGDDKYGRTNFIPDDGSIRSPSSVRRNGDDSSSFTGSSRPRFDYESSKTLVQTSTKSGPPTRKASLTSIKEPVPDVEFSRKPVAPAKDNLLAPAAVDAGRDSILSTTSSNGVGAFRKSNDYLGAFIRGGGRGLNINDNAGLRKESQNEVIEIKPEAPRKQITPPPPAVIKQDQYSYNDPFQGSHSHTTSQPNQNDSTAPQPQLLQLDFDDFSNVKLPTAPEISVTQHKDSHAIPAAHPQPHEQQTYSQGSENYSRENSFYGQQMHSQHQAGENSYYDQQQYGHQQHDSEQYNQPLNPQHQSQEYDGGEDYYDPEEEYADYADYAAYEEQLGYDPRRLTGGMRPLPPDDPSENPEQRANRIRSFYKEYFDAPNGAYQQGYYDEGEYYDDYYSQDEYYPPRGHSSAGGRHRGHTFSNGSYMPGPRAFSSASGRYGHPYGRPQERRPPKKNMPPPKALNILPTPSKLKDDTFCSSKLWTLHLRTKPTFKDLGHQTRSVAVRDSTHQPCEPISL